MFKYIYTIRFLFVTIVYMLFIPISTFSQTTVRLLLWLSDDCYTRTINLGYNPKAVMQSVFNNCNIAFSNRSGVNYQLAGILHYTGVIEDYTQPGEPEFYSKSLSNFQQMGEGGTRRNECAADQNAMAINNNYAPSRIGGMTTRSPSADNAYAVIRWSGAIWDDLTTPHELAHHYGTADPPGHGVLITNPLNNTQQIGTIEAYLTNGLTPYGGKIIYFSENGYVPPNNVSWGLPLTNPNGLHGVTQIQNTRANIAGFRTLQNTTNLQNFTLRENEYFNPVANTTLNCSNVTINNGGELDMRSNGSVQITSLTVDAGGILTITTGAGACIPKRAGAQGDESEYPVTHRIVAIAGYTLFAEKNNGRSVLYYTLPESAPVELIFYNIAGREVGHVIKGRMNMGAYLQEMPMGVSANVYFIKLIAGKNVITQRFISVL
jgi:hypothetical protein